MKISVVIPYYQNLMEVKKAIESAKDADEIVLTHDCSNDYKQILEFHLRVRIYKNIKNWHILHNKRNAIYHAKNEWVVCLDSDNKLSGNYIKILKSLNLKKSIIYAPEYASPRFDFRCYSGMTLSKLNIDKFDKHSIFQCFLNTFNYCINRDEFLKVYQYFDSCYSADSIYFNYLWLKSGRKIHVVEGLQYDHLVHSNSTFLKEASCSMNMANIYLRKVRELI